MKLRLETYSPKEAEAVTNVTMSTVRNWRRLGHLPRPEGPTRYTIADLLHMFVLGLFASRSIAIGPVTGVASEAARAVYQSVIWNAESFEDEVHKKALQEIGEAPAVDIANAKEIFGDSSGIDFLNKVRAQEHMAEAAEKLARIAKGPKPDWLVIWADGSLEFFHEGENADQTFFENIQYGAAYAQGPIIVFCLGALAAMVVDRLPRPAFRLNEEG